ncbi:MAG: hypothetical protein H6667_19985 [Ardenticatenaceae bacterium]|nr:hypothetical protein [Ardenticatenaceae bacterium]MCB9443929.1 hypothetical protein [Ardenticatenaceae bacterium]
MFDLRSLILVIRQHIWLIVTVTVLGAVLALWGMVKIERFPRYSATAVVAIGGDAYYNTQDAGYLELAGAMVENYRRLASLEIITGAVVQALQLPESAHDLTKLLDVTPVADTNLLSIKAFYTDQYAAAAIANEVARQLRALAPPQERNFVLIVETAVPAKLPDITAVIPVMMSALAALSAVVGTVLLISYIRQPILSESDLTTRLSLPVWATINLSRNNPVDWWLLKAACEKRWQAKQPELADNFHLRIFITTPTATPSQAVAARWLAETWQTDGAEAVVVELSDKDAGKRPLLPTMLATTETTWQKNIQYPAVIFYASPVTDPISATFLAQRADIILLLVPLRQTRWAQVQSFLALFSSLDAGVDGLVLVSGQTARQTAIWSGVAGWVRRLWQSNGRFQHPIDEQKVAKTGEAS